MGRRGNYFDKVEAVRLYKEGVCPTDIGRILGVNYRCITTYLTRIGLYSPKPRKNRNNSSENREITMEEKIAYCDKKYGKGNWHFLSKEEFIEELIALRSKDD